jgi:FG-GAP-like repeat
MNFKFLILLLVATSAFLVWECNVGNLNEDIKHGEHLAKVNCSGCHQLPEANLLAKNAWKKLLPSMGLRLGILDPSLQKDSLNPFEIEVFTKQKTISDAEWNQIKEYYLSTAPDSLDNSNKVKLKILNGLFETKLLQLLPDQVPNITAIKIDKKRKQIIAADEINKNIYFIDKNANITNHYGGLPTVSDFQILNDKMLVTFIGRDIKLTKQHNGYDELLAFKSNTIASKGAVLQHLYRPTQSIFANLDKSAANELITCEFGVNTGKFAIWQKQKDIYKEIYIENKPGAIHSEVVDLDNDGQNDVVTLFAQGDEQLVWYKNKGINSTGILQFERKILLRFPPVYGSNYFEIIDMNNDKKLDIVYTCGDNADYTILPKPYHGVYIYNNVGSERIPEYKQIRFMGIDGATKALARDFDNDGDLDIASISFFSNFSSKTTSNFIYFENNNGEFVAKGMDIQKHGRWLVMDANDIDGDGDLDIALGSHPFGETISPHLNSWRNSTGVLLLINQSLK